MSPLFGLTKLFDLRPRGIAGKDRVQRGHTDVDVRKNILRYKSKYIKI